ncbi:uncharacterized protein [Apostichopus japonicus]|uniref:uncharacterized protein n=1 Tax=Stichopus japonicus TaxID=307972 RepID=UPI003AB7DC11
MEFRIALEIFLIISYLLYCGNTNDVCKGVRKPIAKSGICGEDITLSCNFQQTACTIGLWAFRSNSDVNYFTQLDCPNCEESFSVTDVKNVGLITNLHVSALNENRTGLYDCSCQDRGLNQFVQCFSVTLQTLDIKSEQNGDVTDESSMDGNNQRKEIKDQDNKTSNGGFLTKNTFTNFGSDTILTCPNHVSDTPVSTPIDLSVTEVANQSNISVTHLTTQNNASITQITTPSDVPVTKVTTTNDGTAVTKFTTSSDRYTTVRILDTSTEYVYIVILATVAVTSSFIIVCLSCKIYQKKNTNFTENVDWQNPVYESFEDGINESTSGSIKRTQNSKKEFEHDQIFYDGIYYYIGNDKSTNKC